jgi:hypothetical protein
MMSTLYFMSAFFSSLCPQMIQWTSDSKNWMGKIFATWKQSHRMIVEGEAKKGHPPPHPSTEKAKRKIADSKRTFKLLMLTCSESSSVLL